MLSLVDRKILVFVFAARTIKFIQIIFCDSFYLFYLKERTCGCQVNRPMILSQIIRKACKKNKTPTVWYMNYWMRNDYFLTLLWQHGQFVRRRYSIFVTFSQVLKFTLRFTLITIILNRRFERFQSFYELNEYFVALY